MSDYDEAKAWMDIKRFDNASETDGSIWIDNLWLAVNAAIPASIQSPQWFDRGTLNRFRSERASELGELFHPPGIKNFNARKFKSVSALSPIADCYQTEIWPPLLEDQTKIESVDVTPLDERIEAFDKKRAFASIDLTQTDERIFTEFKQWLAVTRKRLDARKPRATKQGYLNSLKKHQVLPYIWLWAWRIKNNKRLTYHQMAKILFPDDRYDGIGPDDKLKNSTRPHAEELACIIKGELNMNTHGFLMLRNAGTLGKG